MPLSYADDFDRVLAASGPPAVFTLTADGELRLHADRTRDAWQRLAGGAAPPHEPCHCLLRDQATGWVQYALVTSPVLCASHPRADVWRYADEAEALAALARAGQPPVWRGDRL
ncbi:hypothetical protein L6R53_20965 [Myxococcota bacterium]|nr:hypothetical protein [Myxococcota bacterium]